ncbi:hypothetical protein GA0115234_1104154 [Streptomyces sp. DvalAA-43]|nr:hypothetical protein GA0115234_1104154 [Streptomyces sp. DvalAA-43]
MPGDLYSDGRQVPSRVEVDALTAPLGLPEASGHQRVRKERPHPGAQLRFTDADGLRLTAFATNTTSYPGRRTRTPPPAAGPSRGARATGLRDLLLHDTAQNQIWRETVQIALELLTWMAILAPTR